MPDRAQPTLDLDIPAVPAPSPPPTAQLPSVLTIHVLGSATPQGSKHGRPIYRGKKGARVFTGKVAVVEQMKVPLQQWRSDIKAAADAHAGHFPAGMPVRVVVYFSMRRPTTAPKRRRTWPIGRRNDVDKLLRSTFDALTAAAVFPDDGQVQSGGFDKDYAGYGPGPQHPGATIIISPVTEGTRPVC